MIRATPSLVDIGAAFPGYSQFAFLAPSGQKCVLKARDSQGTRVALKLVAPSQDGTEYLKREIETVRRLSLPYVPTIHQDGDRQVGGEIWHYLVEQLIEGAPLNDVLSAGPLPPAEIHKLTLTLLKACAAFESANIVHRDIKPNNIIRGTDGSFWVIDFGLVRMLEEESLTLTAQPFGRGTPAYAAPEAIRNQKSKIDAKTDLFSTGLTIYEAINGANPHKVGKRDLLGVIHSIENSDIPALQCAGLDREFMDFICSLCNRRRTARPATAAKALETYEQNYDDA